MELPWQKKDDLLEVAKSEILEQYLASDDEDEKAMLLNRYIGIDEQSLEHEKIRAEHKIDAKTILGTVTTLVLAGATLIFEQTDVLHSKVVPLWLRRRLGGN